ncbi:MAG: EamA family transporter [Firmicutes bacterium]|nr:EamA family transporter [Bacillota bacterium]
MWFLFALFSTLAWGIADLFYKKSSIRSDRYSHLKIVITVGTVMGLHGIGYMIANGLSFSPYQIIWYLPVSSCYILSMTIGYIGLRYIELSISSPVQNSSGAVTVLLLFIFFNQSLGRLGILAIIIISAGVLGIAILEKRKEEQEIIRFDSRHRFSLLAITLPILYCFIDGLGTFADGIYLDELRLISENDALLAFEFTFFICAFLAFFYHTVIKKRKFNIIEERNKVFAAIFETTGQFFYVFAMAGSAIITVPLVSAYSVVSVILSRIFLKERLTGLQYLIIFFVVIGIVLLGLTREL